MTISLTDSCLELLYRDGADINETRRLIDDIRALKVELQEATRLLVKYKVELQKTEVKQLEQK